MGVFKPDRHSSTEERVQCPDCGTWGISRQDCPNPRCGRALAPGLGQVFLDPFLDVANTAKRSFGRSQGGGGSSSSAGVGCVVLLMVVVGVAVLWMILPYLIGAALVIGAGVFYYFLGKKVGFLRMFLVFAGLGAVGFVLVIIRARSHRAAADEEEKRQADESRQQLAKEAADETKAATAKHALFQAGYTQLVTGTTDTLPPALLGPWKMAQDGGLFVTTATLTASMMSGLDPDLSNLRVRVTSEHLLLSGVGKSYGKPVTCAAAAEPVGLADRMLLALECQADADGSLTGHVYLGANKALAKTLHTAASSGETNLLPVALRGVWLADDDDCSSRKPDSKRRTIVTASVVLGNGGREDDGILQVHASASGDSTTFDGLAGSSFSPKPCKGQIDAAGAGSYLMNIKCGDEDDGESTHLCKKAATWQDLQ